MINIFFLCLLFYLFLILNYSLSGKFKLFEKILIITYLFSSLIYLIWRTLFTLPHTGILNIFMGFLLLLAEWDGFLQSVVFYGIFWHRPQQKKQDLKSLTKLPSIDILIATYNEETEILKKTIIAALNVDYPAKNKVKVYLCDDGQRLQVKKMCEELGANYLTRTKHQNAKAGNLNHALAYTTGDLILTMDADMIPRKNILTEMVGFFSDPKMGFVQSPQTFYNQDPYQFNLYAGQEMGNEQDFFMRKIEEQKDAFNATMYIGSNAIFRRTALESIGGFSTGVITEDMATGMLLQSKGWKSHFVNKNLASGLAPESFSDLIKQRDRWGRGNIQVFKKWNPLKLKGLSLTQKIIYLDGIHYWFFGIRKMIFLLAPLLFLTFGIQSLNVSFFQLLLFWIPQFVSSYFCFNAVANGWQNISSSNIYETAMAPSQAAAVIAEIFFKGKNKFVVTRKGVQTNKQYFNWEVAMPLVILAILSVISLVKAIYTLLNPQQDINGIYLNLFWIIYNIVGLFAALSLCFERPRFRKAERFSSNKTGQIIFEKNKIPIKILDWNENGARLSGNLAEIRIQSTYLQTGNLLVDQKKFKFKIVWVNNYNHQFYIGIKFYDLTLNQLTYLIEQTYALPITEKEYPTDHPFKALILLPYRFIRKSFRYRRKEVRLKTSQKIILVDLNSKKNAVANMIDISNSGCQLIVKRHAWIKKDAGILIKFDQHYKKIGKICWKKNRIFSANLGIQFKKDVKN